MILEEGVVVFMIRRVINVDLGRQGLHQPTGRRRTGGKGNFHEHSPNGPKGAQQIRAKQCRAGNAAHGPLARDHYTALCHGHAERIKYGTIDKTTKLEKEEKRRENRRSCGLMTSPTPDNP